VIIPGDDEFLLQIKKSLPAKVQNLLRDLTKLGFRLCLVGGSIRDIILYNKLGHDLDFELSFECELTEDEWLLKRNELIFFLDCCDIKTSVAHKFGVIQFDYLSFNIELAPARLEIFNRGQIHGHGDVGLKLITKIQNEDSFKRRDFTINAIGALFLLKPHSNELFLDWFDPLHGKKSLEKQLLRPCSENFIYDPVRFLRAIRFRLKTQFQMSPLLKDYMSKMDLSFLTSHYFFSESFKSHNFFHFIKVFFGLISEYQTQLNPKLYELKFLAEVKNTRDCIHHEDVLKVLIENECDKYNLEIYRNRAGLRKSLLSEMVKSSS